jgi:recombination protein RecA
MASAALLRAQLEASLSDRVPGAFTLRTRQAPELYPSGIPELDNLLGGGIPRGGITEITGSATTGRTSLALSLLAQLTRKGGVCAWVDVQDSLDPETAAAHGVCLERLLWLRVAGAAVGKPTPATASAEKGRPQPPRETPAGTAVRHPRNEMRAMNQAVSQLFRSGEGRQVDKRAAPSSTNHRVLEFDAIGARCVEAQPHRRKIEQIPLDRQPPRRGEAVLEGRARRMREAPSFDQQQASLGRRLEGAKPQPRLERALGAADLLLQAGGFGAIVLDMGDVRADHVARIAISYWHRFRLAAEQAQTALILVTQSPCAKSCASLVLRCSANETAPWRLGSERALFTALRYGVTIERMRHEGIDPQHKKSVARASSAAWRTQAPWAR